MPQTPEIKLRTTLTLRGLPPPSPLTIPLHVSVWWRDIPKHREIRAENEAHVYQWDLDTLRDGHADSVAVPGSMWVSGLIKLRLALERLDEIEGLALWRATPAQLERMAESAESREIELLTIVRAELFAPFGRFHKRVRLRAAAIAHKDDCLSSPEVDWSTRRPQTRVGAEILPKMHAVAYEVAKHPWLAERSPEDGRHCKLRLEQRHHHGVCRCCRAEISEHTVLVTVYWAGRELSREYVLTSAAGE
jgi:hypothetical protein